MPDPHQECRVLLPVHRGGRPRQAVDGSRSEAQRAGPSIAASSSCRRAVMSPASTRASTNSAASTRRRPTSRSSARTNVRYYISKRQAGPAQSAGRQLHPQHERQHHRLRRPHDRRRRNGEWKYVNVRRVMLFLKESIDEGTQWVVFEPNDPSLWAQDSAQRERVPHQRVASGALFGLTPRGGVLRQVRRGDESRRGARRRAGGYRDRRGDRAAGGVRDLPHHAVGRADQVVSAGGSADAKLRLHRQTGPRARAPGVYLRFLRSGTDSGISNAAVRCLSGCPHTIPAGEPDGGVQIHRLSRVG